MQETDSKRGGFALDDIDPETLYLADGTVNFEACRLLIESTFDPSYDTLSGIAIASPMVELDMSSEGFDIENEQFKRENPVSYALIMTVAMDIAKSMEVELPMYPIDDALYEDPTTVLSAPDQLQRHFGFLEENAKIAMNFIERAQASLGESTNSTDNLRGVVAIPVAGHQEHENIYRTLHEFAKQDVGCSEFEILLNINLPVGEKSEAEHRDSLADSVRKTIEEIERFKSANPQVVTRYFVTSYEGSLPKIGKIRSDLWEVAGYDLMQRGLSNDLLIVSADADVISLNPGYLRSMFETFEATDADIVAANLKWQKAPNLPYTATVNRVLRYQTFMDIVRNNHAIPHTADANTGISLAMYFASGGYNRDLKLAEMRDLVSLIAGLRSDRDQEVVTPVKQVIVRAKDAWLRSHSRRLMLVMAKGYSPYRAWNQDLITFGPDDELRTLEMQEELADQMAQQHWKEWLKELTPAYTTGIDTKTKRRLLKNGRRILGFSDLYK